jgi:Ca2+-binding EF-hand superfamily protein
MGVLALSLENLSQMTETEEDRFFKVFEAELAHDDGSVAREHLQAGRAIVYTERDTPAGHVLREFPNGRVELVDYSDGTARFVRVVKP